MRHGWRNMSLATLVGSTRPSSMGMISSEAYCAPSLVPPPRFQAFHCVYVTIVCRERIYDGGLALIRLQGWSANSTSDLSLLGWGGRGGGLICALRRNRGAEPKLSGRDDKNLLVGLLSQVPCMGILIGSESSKLGT
ncbi:hypothetical protein U1Q18_041759 [Sarracenia purpurea var. burkii]